MLESQCNENVTIEHSDGTRHENVRALVTGRMILVPDSRVPISPNDVILRELPSGLVERLVVADPGFYQAVHGIPPHYQVKYRRESAGPRQTPGYNIHLSGDNARVNISSTDNSHNTIVHQSYEIQALSVELSKLRDALAQRAKTAEEFTAIAAVATAESGAKERSPSKVSKALSGLGAAGKWVLETAKDIGVEVAATVIRSHMGLSG